MADNEPAEAFRRGMTENQSIMPEILRASVTPALTGQADSARIICPVCGAIAAQEKCKMICRSDICRGRVVMNCSEF